MKSYESLRIQIEREDKSLFNRHLLCLVLFWIWRNKGESDEVSSSNNSELSKKPSIQSIQTSNQNGVIGREKSRDNAEKM